MRSWRTASVALLSFSSGLPLGLVWIAIPDWMRSAGVDIRIVGLLSLAQAPWSFKVLWAPLMDRWTPQDFRRRRSWAIAQLALGALSLAFWTPPHLGRRRGWAASAQVALLVLGLALAACAAQIAATGLGDHPAWMMVGALALAIAFASATQDVAVDAYAVDVLRDEEQGVAVGARIALYRAAMFVAGGLSITLAAQIGWAAVNAVLALCYLPMLVVTWRAPEPESALPPPRTLRDAVWLPFLGLLARHRALEILAFVILYKLADNLAGALTRPFLIDMGYDELDRGVALATVGLGATLLGTVGGGLLTTLMGLGHALWAFGLLQIFSNVGYVLVAQSPPDRWLMYGATGFESLTSGMGTGAFSVLLLRMTQKRFSATQYALFSSLFGLSRVLAGPVSGFVVDALGWSTFYWITIASGLPGMVLLARFVPLGVREPEFVVEPVRAAAPLAPGALVARGVAGALVTIACTALALALLASLKSDVGLLAALEPMLRPSGVADWLQLVGVLATGIIAGLFVAAVAAARRGAGGDASSTS
jgi:PAT family beta-lactamase induction signal transducer AmpG